MARGGVAPEAPTQAIVKVTNRSLVRALTSPYLLFSRGNLSNVLEATLERVDEGVSQVPAS
jgi:hypothetical protein